MFNSSVFQIYVFRGDKGRVISDEPMKNIVDFVFLFEIRFLLAHCQVHRRNNMFILYTIILYTLGTKYFKPEILNFK